jgi:hypothetical protein
MYCRLAQSAVYRPEQGVAYKYRHEPVYRPEQGVVYRYGQEPVYRPERAPYKLVGWNCDDLGQSRDSQ